MDIHDYRMQFINALASYLDNGLMPFPIRKTNVAAIEEACGHLRDDQECMPSTFHHVMRTLCDHDFQTWRSSGDTWSSAARFAIYFLTNHETRENGTPITSGGRRLNKAYAAT